MNELIPRTTVSAIVGARDGAMATMREAIGLLEQGHALASDAAATSQGAHGGQVFTGANHADSSHYSRLFARLDPAESLEQFRRQLDARTWMNLIAMTGIRDLMDRTAKDDLYKDLSSSVPEVTEEAVYSILENLVTDADLIFQRGLARAFSDLDSRFKSHDAFKVGSRIILTRVFDEWGMWNYHNSARETIADIERVFAVLDGNRVPDIGALARVIEESRAGRGSRLGRALGASSFGPRQSTCETEYFRIHTFKNGNAHLWMLRDDLVEKANLVLAKYYGEVLPDSVPEGTPEADLRSKSGALSKDLAFYPTPPEVVSHALRNIHIDANSHVLEPSAGTGNMARELLKTGARVKAIEVHPDRFQSLIGLSMEQPRLRCIRGNFLRSTPVAEFTHVVMNPPFYGTHWMQHVVHAFDFLAPGGTLVAILPVTAELGTSGKHTKFRAWAKKHVGYGSPFRDLPSESFASSGTRVNTVVLTLHRARA